jgi:hypothetical protein
MEQGLRGVGHLHSTPQQMRRRGSGSKLSRLLDDGLGIRGNNLDDAYLLPCSSPTAIGESEEERKEQRTKSNLWSSNSQEG